MWPGFWPTAKSLSCSAHIQLMTEVVTEQGWMLNLLSVYREPGSGSCEMRSEYRFRTPPPYVAMKQSGTVQHPSIQTLNDVGLNV